MNKVMRLYFRFNTEYKGYQMYVSGNALRHCLGMQLNCSVGKFTSSTKLHYPKNYEEYFMPRTEDIFLRPFYHSFFSKCENRAKTIIFFRPLAITFDVLDYPDDMIDLIKKKELLQVGGGRTKGYGSITLHDWMEIDLDDFELPTKGTHLTLISPLIEIPDFVHEYKCRHNHEIIWNNGKQNRIKIVSPGQFFRMKQGKDIQKIALKGMLRKTLFGKFGYGEWKLHYWKEAEN